MILDGLHSGGVFQHEVDRLALPFIEKHTPQVHDPISHDDIQKIDRDLRLLLELGVDARTDRQIVARRLGFADNARKRP